MTWGGRKVERARAYWRDQMVAAGGTLPCWRCGRPLRVDGTWTVGHLVDRALGGDETDPANQWPECPRCNYRAGGRLGAARTNSKRGRQVATTPAPALSRTSERDRGIRGW